MEADTFARELVNVWCLGVLVAEAGEVTPAQVIDEDHDDVGLAGWFGEGVEGEEEEKREDGCKECWHGVGAKRWGLGHGHTD